MSAQPVDQRRSALDRANRIRVWRARFKRDLKTHPHLATFQLKTPTPWIESMRVAELVRALPYYGEAKTLRLLLRCGIPAEKTIGTLTQRQRDELTKALA
jgi:hypothetical protein